MATRSSPSLCRSSIQNNAQHSCTLEACTGAAALDRRSAIVLVGIEDSIDDSYLQDLPENIQIVRISPEPHEEIEVEVWLSSLSNATSRRQLPYLKGIKFVQALTAGVDALIHIVPPGITLCDARTVHDISTAEWAVMAVLAMQKNIPFFAKLQQRADWSARDEARSLVKPIPVTVQKNSVPALTEEIAEKTILIVGYGSIGRAIEARLSPFGPVFLRIARSAREGVAPVSDLDALLPQADIVILITPSTSETHHLMNAGRIAKMKHGALLVNAGRGPVVDTDALLQALTENRIRAALDVTDPEPLPQGHPLWHAPNLLITPHIATDTSMFTARAYRFASEQVGRYVRGEELLNIVAGEY